MKRPGFTIIEVVLTIALLAILTSTLFPLVAWLTAKSRSLKYQGEAGMVMQEGVEVAYNKLLSDWDEKFSQYPEGDLFHPAVEDGKWILSSGEETGVNGRFSRNITLSKICRNKADGKYKEGITGCADTWQWDKNSKLVKVHVEWNEKGEKVHDDMQLLVTKL